METVLRRMVAVGSNREATTINRLVGYRKSVRAEGVSVLESGYVRMRDRRQRRSGMPLQSPLVFYPWHWAKTLRGLGAYLSTTLRLRAILWRIQRDPQRFAYRDAALTLAGEADAEFVAATRVTDYARRRMGRAAEARAAQA